MSKDDLCNQLPVKRGLHQSTVFQIMKCQVAATEMNTQ